ncbi:ABC transporter permease [Paenibacillus sp.]|uniref:ABC transporter permease n=1 Tax=Paenibacillus sp. TaxID=58172 RepID=UPI002D5ABBAB|nr:ABC transporter permease [Paenibacillus sp.]HZG84751.1 ABC transporter permease [Paenibacillus sp.]
MLRSVRSELLKLRRSPLWAPALVSPALTTLVCLADAGEGRGDPWTGALGSAALLHGLLFLPLLAGVFAALVCRFEHAGGGWKQILAMPVRPGDVFLAKFGVVAGLLAFVQLLVFGGVLLAGLLRGFPAPAPWELLLRCAVGGWVASLPLAALQLGASAAWSGFAGPMAANVILTLPNMLIANSERYGPYYPWAQPALAMIPREALSFGAFNVPLDSLLLVVAGSFVLFFAGSFAYFVRKEV